MWNRYVDAILVCDYEYRTSTIYIAKELTRIFKFHFSDIDYHVTEVDMFIKDIYVSVELTHMLFVYKIARFL